MDGVRERVRAYRDVLDPGTQIGIHAHENLSLSVANSVVAVEEGVTRVDASLAGQGAGAGNCPDRSVRRGRQSPAAGSTAAISSRSRTPPTTSSARCGTGRFKSTAKPSHSATPASTRPSCAMPRTAARIYGIDARTLLLEVGRRGLVGGQEDMIVDIALDLVGQPAAATAS